MRIPPRAAHPDELSEAALGMAIETMREKPLRARRTGSAGEHFALLSVSIRRHSPFAPIGQRMGKNRAPMNMKPHP
jgi:hypothetical protein